MYHVSDIKKYVRCPKLFWYSLHLDNEPYIPYVRMDEAVSDLVIKKLQINNYFLGQRNDTHEHAMQATKTYAWLVKARFEYQGIRIKVPFMHKVEDRWDIYFVSISVLPKDDDIQYYTYTVWVLLQLGFNINEIKIVHLNKDYVREENLDVNQLLCINDTFYNSKGKPTRNITKTILHRLVDLSPLVSGMDEVAALKELRLEKSKQCVRKTKCKYYNLCFNDDLDLEDDSIMTLVSSQYKSELFNNNIRLLKDAPLDKIEGTRQQFAQIMASRNQRSYIDKLALEHWLKNNLSYPYAFLDFEWETYAVPPYPGLRAFDVVPFAYSLHVLQQDQTLSHEAYMGIQDCREAFILGLLKDIPEKGSIIAYNGEGAEKLRLLELAKQFPKYQNQLKALAERIVDLSIPFMNGLVYDIRMRGMYSLKVLHSIISSNQSYKDLAIHHGMDAVFKWRSLDKQEEVSDDIKTQLLEYCTLDTYAMVLVVQWLNALIKEHD